MPTATSDERSEGLLAFWFGPPGTPPLAHESRWWSAEPAFDAEVRARFEPDVVRATRGELERWRETPRGALAYIVLLDQLSRNMYRGTPASFAQDPLALAASIDGRARGVDAGLSPIERGFFCMPLMHAEDREMQRRSVVVFTELAAGAPEVVDTLRDWVRYAQQHRDIIDRFGRFPHRNAILGRLSTPAELEFLAGPNSRF